MANIIKLIRSLFFVVAVLLLLRYSTIEHVVSSGNVFYVALTGSDDSPGTQDLPWKTIQHAVDTARPGNTILVREGAYHESVKFRRSGEAENPITLTVYIGESVTIDGGENPAIDDNRGTGYWIIDGFTLNSDHRQTVRLRSGNCDRDAICEVTQHWIMRNNTIVGAASIHGNYIIFENNEFDGSQHKGNENAIEDLYEESHHNIFRDNHIHDFDSRGIWTRNRTHDNIMENNHIHDILGERGQCINIDGFGNVEWRHVVRGNQLHNCGKMGVALENAFDTIVENNII